MTIIDQHPEIVQGSPEWKALRLGKVTASRVSDMIAKTKSGYSTSRVKYMIELVAERMTGTATEFFVTRDMEWGTLNEPAARIAYEYYSDTDVKQIAFVDHPAVDMAGCSPDGLVNGDGLVEIKCPASRTHIETLLSQEVPTDYLPQIQFQMACTGRQWCDFISYDPRMPDHLKLFVRRVVRDDAAILKIEQETTAFLSEIEAKIAALNKMGIV